MQEIEAREGRPLDELLQELYVERGMFLAEIGDRFGVTESAVSQWLKWAGIRARKGGPHQRGRPSEPATESAA